MVTGRTVSTDLETAVTELQKRVEKLESEKLELVKVHVYVHQLYQGMTIYHEHEYFSLLVVFVCCPSPCYSRVRDASNQD